MIGLVIFLPGISLFRSAQLPTATQTLTLNPTVTAIPASPTPTLPPVSTATAYPAESLTPRFPNGVMVLSLADGYYRHLFAYHPADLSFTRITNHPWDDMQPAISPDGTRLAYTSRRNGFWDIYLVDLSSRESIRVTDTPAYDGNPTWSPDGQWLAYESVQSGNLDIFVQSLTDLSKPPIQLTKEPAADFDPDWSPSANVIAFTSVRTGEPEIWIAALDQTENRFQNFSRDPTSADTQPAWSPDGKTLAWTTADSGDREIAIGSFPPVGTKTVLLGSGTSPFWDSTGVQVLASIDSPHGIQLAGFNAFTGLISLPPVPIPSIIFGADWLASSLADKIVPLLESTHGGPVSPLASVSINRATDSPTGRTGLVSLVNVTAPYPYLSDDADEVFNALRSEIARLSGWDVLANLENAYLPFTAASLPAAGDDWLYTGLGIAINPLPYQAGWMVVQREDRAGEVFWRLFLLARYQDGSQGEPISGPVWDLNARSNGKPVTYEQGGALSPAPSGYWIDLTELASRFGWEPLPAYANWRSFFSAARFNQFAFTGGQSWETAMSLLYPAELVNQPTLIPSLTPFPSSTPLPQNARTATAQAAPNLSQQLVSQPRPTWTPLPEAGFP